MILKKLFAKIKSLKSSKDFKKYFWWWVLYQAIKGLITTAIIWIPLIYAFTKK